jgi:osmoprotectant transport system substrate-binding protein/osmoprotectant transport system permease protein
MANAAILIVLTLLSAGPSSSPPTARVGSKTFTESVVLGELARELIESAGVPAIHRRELGGTQVLFHALEADQLDLYPEYTGTISGEILANKKITDDTALRAALLDRGVGISRSVGFNNTYAIGMREEVAARLGVSTLSDLRHHPELKFGFSNEFVERADGWPGLRDRYALPQRDVRGLDHDLAYRALKSDEIQATDLYSTDAEIKAYGLRALRDDREFFPRYECVWLYRTDFPTRCPEAFAAISRLEGKITAPEMAAMNARAKIDRVGEDKVAAEYLKSQFAIDARIVADSYAERVLQRLREHVALVAISLSAAIAVAIPLGVLAARRPKLGSVILSVTGIIQTIPSLALLVFMIPWLGIGAGPALVALFLYSLLPIVRNTATGLGDIPTSLRESAEALGLPSHVRLFRIELPIASRAILSGIKIAAVIDVGTATIGALIGAGGFGQPILTGIRRDDVSMILFEGAIPAAVLALAVQLSFDLVERFLVPKGLRT